MFTCVTKSLRYLPAEFVLSLKVKSSSTPSVPSIPEATSTRGFLPQSCRTALSLLLGVSGVHLARPFCLIVCHSWGDAFPAVSKERNECKLEPAPARNPSPTADWAPDRRRLVVLSLRGAICCREEREKVRKRCRQTCVGSPFSVPSPNARGMSSHLELSKFSSRTWGRAGRLTWLKESPVCQVSLWPITVWSVQYVQ